MKLSEYLKKNGIKQIWLASQLDYSASHLCNIISGKSRPSKKFIRQIYLFTKGHVTEKDF